MANLLISLKELGEVSTTQRDFALKCPVAVFDRTKTIVAYARYVTWAALATAKNGGPMYGVVESSGWKGTVSQDYTGGPVDGAGLNLVGPSAAGASVDDNPAAATLLLVRALGYGWCQTHGDNVVALSVKTAITKYSLMVGSTADGFWDDNVPTVNTSAAVTAFNMGYSGVGGFYWVASASSLVAIPVGGAHVNTLFAGGVGL